MRRDETNDCRPTHSVHDTTTAAGGGGGGGAGRGGTGSVMCAPILNADGHVIAVALLSNSLTSSDVHTFSDDDEKVHSSH